MNRENDIAYFERRVREERSKAENAPDPIGYRLHTNFAREYERRLNIMYREYRCIESFDRRSRMP